jgi:hypothetical protein
MLLQLLLLLLLLLSQSHAHFWMAGTHLLLCNRSPLPPLLLPQ